jgi:hypothetical protein
VGVAVRTVGILTLLIALIGSIALVKTNVVEGGKF